MPIPTLKGDVTREEAVKEYAKFGWTKRTRFDWIEVDQRNGTYLKKTYDVNADAMPCSSADDASYQLTFVQVVPTGIVWTCGMCRKTEGPLAFEASGFRLIEQKQVSLTEAWDTIKMTNQKPPIGLQPLSGREGFRLK
jgi:hypothetical protein